MGKIKKTFLKTDLESFIFIALLLCSIFTGAMGSTRQSAENIAWRYALLSPSQPEPILLPLDMLVKSPG